MSTPRRILFVAPRLPLPADTGAKIRTFHLIRQARRWYDVDLICYGFGAGEREVAGLRAMGVGVTLVPWPLRPWPSRIGQVLCGGTPHSVWKYDTVAFRDRLREILARRTYVVVHTDHIHMAPFRVCAGEETATVLDEHNVEYRILERCAGVTRDPLRRAVYHLQTGRMRRFEAAAARRFTACLTVSEDDRTALERLTRGCVPVSVVPNGVDTGFFSPDGKDADDGLVFTGSMDWLPNEDAVIFFRREILPGIWKRRPRTRFYVVGRNPSGRLRACLAGDDRIVVTGGVEDIRPFVRDASVYVVPIRVGGGTRLKILEAMAMGKPVVSTTVGAEGIAHTPGRDIVLADAPDDFVRAVVSLLEDADRRRSTGAAARDLVLRTYDWDIVGERLRRVYSEACRAHPGGVQRAGGG